MAFGSCPGDHGAEAAAPIQQPMITGESGDTDASSQSRTVRQSCWISTGGFKPIGLFVGRGNSIIGDVASQRVARDLQSAWRSAGKKNPETVSRVEIGVARQVRQISFCPNMARHRLT